MAMVTDKGAALQEVEGEIAHRHAMRDPGAFLSDALGAGPYSKQVAIAQAMDRHRRVSVVGCNGSGKDWVAGRMILWWLKRWEPEPAKVVVTGPTHRQVAEIVWRETRQAYHEAKIPLGGSMLPREPMWELGDERFAIGFSTERPMGLQGFHSPHLLVIVTEAHGMAQADMDALKRLNPERTLLTGNPLVDSGEFYDSHHSQRGLYHPISILAEETPNVRGGRTVVPGLVTQEDIDERRQDWGEDSPLFQAYIGRWPESLEAGLFPLAWLTAAKGRGTEEGPHAAVVAGLDVAGSADDAADETVLSIREGPNLLEMHTWRLADPRGEVVAALAPWRDRLLAVNVDAIGVGHHMATHLQDQGLPVQAVNVTEAPRKRERFRDLKAELYWGMRQRLEDGDMNGLSDETTIAQLSSVRYEHNSRGQIVIESKKEAKRRGIRSPDRAEALILSFIEPLEMQPILSEKDLEILERREVDREVGGGGPSGGLWGREW